MVYAYLRVSTGKQDGANQRLGVEDLAKRLGLTIDEYIDDEGVSGTKEPEKRELGKLMKMLKPGDVLLAGEISRLGRSLFMVMRILEFCMNNGVKVYTAKDGYELGDNIQSKVLAFAFGLAAEIEREMISRRTKEALAKRKAEGVALGRPKGRKSSRVKLTGYEEDIQGMLDDGISQMEIADKYHVNRGTLYKFIKDNGLEVGRTGIKTKQRRRCKLEGMEPEIQKLLCDGVSKTQIAKQYGTSIATLNEFISNYGLIVYPRKKAEPKYKLDGQEDKIRLLLDMGVPKTSIAKSYGMSAAAVTKFIRAKGIESNGMTEEERAAVQQMLAKRRQKQ